MSSRRHYIARVDDTLGPVAICGWFGGGIDRYVHELARVTCRRCQRRERRPVEAVDPQPRRSWPAALIGAKSEPRDRPERTWPRWRDALAWYVVRMDDEFPLRSTSDPRRFEALPGAGAESGHGDVAHRLADDSGPVARALSRAFPETVDGLTQQQCETVLVWRVVGKPVSREARYPNGTVRRLSTYVARLRIEDEEIAAQLAERFGRPLTATVVEEVAVRGGLRIEAELFTREVITQRDEALHRKRAEEIVGAGRGNRLRGQKEIAAYLGVSERTVLRMKNEYEPPIPIIEVGGTDQAWTEDLDEWERMQPKPGKATG